MTRATHRILVVEADPAMSKLLTMLFETNGFRAVVADTCELGISKTHSQRPDICLLDLGLPDRDGIDFVREVRTWSPVPIMVVTARTHDSQRLAAFEAGADDYVIKPFNSLELLARVRAILRRAVRRDHPSAILRLGRTLIDLQNHLTRGPHGDEVKLTPLEHRILECLVRHTGSVVSHERILSEVWGPGHADVPRLRVYVAMLRRKLEIDPAQPKYILTVSGVGYRLKAESEARLWAL
jgi:two-component system, OmpR family, KDP operon response regulator KdpE